MIVQTSLSDSFFVIRQTDHAGAAGSLAAAFGNERFAALTPKDLLVDVVGHHDEGWAEVDDALHFDARTGLPYHLGETPFDLILRTNRGSPDFNEELHPLCGILSSMHCCGFYNGRYGLRPDRRLDSLPVEKRSAVNGLLTDESKRQKRLKAALRTLGRLAWADEDFIFLNYRHLQFFDLLALYFHLEHPQARERREFKAVPASEREDCDIVVEPLGDSCYRLRPYPFVSDGLEFVTRGRYVRPQNSRAALKEAFQKGAIVEQRVRLVA